MVILYIEILLSIYICGSGTVVQVIVASPTGPTLAPFNS